MTQGRIPGSPVACSTSCPRNSRVARGTVVYAIALVVCAICWLMMWRSQDWGAVTVRDVLYNFMMGAVTVTVLWQTIASALHAADV